MTGGFTAAFVKIEEFLLDQSPLALLSQLALTYLFVPSGEFQGESSETAAWERRIEFLTGYLLARPHPSGDFPVVTGHTLEAAKQLLDEYYHAVRMHLLPHVAGDAQVSPAETILRTAKFHSMHVRGEAYPHQFEQFAAELYGPHDPWLRQNLGFTIGEAINLAAAIRREYERRNRSSKVNAREEAKAQTDALIADGQADEQNRRELELSIGCQLHYGNAENLLAFTLEELAEISGLSSETCQSFLDRMSQEFGYHNPQFPNTFTDALAAPWDYNALSERPLITHDGRHWLPLFPALRQALFNTFYFDLMADASYRPAFERGRGAYLETKTADYLRRFFPPDAVLLNPNKLNNEEFADVAVLHDGRILIVQCKSKTLTRPARIGADLEALRTDLRKAIQEAFQQGIVARDYLRSKDTPEIIVGNRALAIDMSQVTAIYIVNVTLAPFQMLATRLANCNPALGLFAGNEYPWSLALGDLDILTQVLRSPATFLHYATRRLQLERTPFDFLADEMDLLGFYLAQGMYFDTPEFNSMNAISIVGLSSDVDRWVFERYEMGNVAEPPKPPMPAGFEELIADIERSNAMYRTDCAIALLDLGYKGREEFMRRVEEAKQKTRADGALHSFALTMKGGKRGISFVSLNANGDTQKLFRNADSFAMLKKHVEKADEWVGFGWDSSSRRSVDVSLFAAYDWVPNPEMDEFAKSHLKPGTEDQP